MYAKSVIILLFISVIYAKLELEVNCDKIMLLFCNKHFLIDISLCINTQLNKRLILNTYILKIINIFIKRIRRCVLIN